MPKESLETLMETSIGLIVNVETSSFLFRARHWYAIIKSPISETYSSTQYLNLDSKLNEPQYLLSIESLHKHLLGEFQDRNAQIFVVAPIQKSQEEG